MATSIECCAAIFGLFLNHQSLLSQRFNIEYWKQIQENVLHKRRSLSQDIGDQSSSTA